MSGLVMATLEVKPRTWSLTPGRCPVTEEWNYQRGAPIPVECMYGASDGQTYTCPMLEFVCTDDLGRRRADVMGHYILAMRMETKGINTFYTMCKRGKHTQWRIGAGPLP